MVFAYFNLFSYSIINTKYFSKFNEPISNLTLLGVLSVRNTYMFRIEVSLIGMLETTEIYSFDSA